jgi:hypothetical protein
MRDTRAHPMHPWLSVNPTQWLSYDVVQEQGQRDAAFPPNSLMLREGSRTWELVNFLGKVSCATQLTAAPWLQHKAQGSILLPIVAAH